MTAGRRVWIRFPIGVLHLLHHCFSGVEWADGNLIPSDPSNLVSLCLNGTKQKGAVNALLIPPIFHLDSLPVFELQLLWWRLKGRVLLFFCLPFFFRNPSESPQAGHVPCQISLPHTSVLFHWKKKHSWLQEGCVFYNT